MFVPGLALSEYSYLQLRVMILNNYHNNYVQKCIMLAMSFPYLPDMLRYVPIGSLINSSIV